MDVEITSSGFIKPSSLTPSHLKTYNVSLLDQFMPPIFYSTALFYPNTSNKTDRHDHISQRSLLLKHSLSKTLSHFYSLAGKIKDYLSIDCNDEGAYYTEAKANIPLSEFLAHPDLTSLKEFVPDVSLSNQNPIGASVVMIQETTFACGGLAIGFSVSHMALDGTALASFIKAWASAAASSNVTSPNLDSPFVFPQHEAFPGDAYFTSMWAPFARKHKVFLRRLVFDASAIDKLKAKVAESTRVETPSRVEVVSAIISKSVKDALNCKAIAISHGVNMRRKATPPFPDCSLGNFVWNINAFYSENEETNKLSSIVYQLRNAIRKVDSEFVKKAIKGGFSELYEEIKEMKNGLSIDGMELVSFSSWCNFGLYSNSDFGWGNPIWISHCSLVDSEEIPFYNMCALNDTASGNGVEAWLYLSQNVAAFVDKDEHLLQYASINPPPLTISSSI